jgi:ssDNA-binding Zn-finger/Zn-ribbon topoisomerase 1
MSRGFGRGRGGPRQGIGGPGSCRCPTCGYTIAHTRGTPCATISCPKCGSRLVGSS